MSQAETDAARERAKQADERVAAALAAQEAAEKQRQEAERQRREAQAQAEVGGACNAMLGYNAGHLHTFLLA